MPSRPLHILFLNLVIDVAPAMALAFEPGEKDMMDRPPRKARGGLVNRLFLARIVTSGIVLGICSFLVFQFCLGRQPSLAYAQTAAFTFMTVAQLMHILNVRKESGFGLDATLVRNKACWLRWLYRSCSSSPPSTALHEQHPGHGSLVYRPGWC